MISLLLLIQKLQVQTSPHYSHSSLCPPAGSILRILRIVANIEPLPPILHSGNYGTNILLSFELNYTVHYSVACYNQKQSVSYFSPSQ